jgi:hypothetical protein
MPTLRLRRLDEIPPENQESVASLLAGMHGREHLDCIFAAQAYRPAYTATNNKQALASYQFQGCSHSLPRRPCTSRCQVTNGCWP